MRLRQFGIIIALFFLGGVYTAAQTTVTATVVDANGNPYANGTAAAQSVVASGQISSTTSPVATNSSGLFSISLPSGISYVFTICAAPTLIGTPTTNPTPKQICFASGAIAISGGTQDISTQLNAIAPVLGPLKPVVNNSNVSGQVNGVIPLATGPTALTAQSHISDSGSLLTSTESHAFKGTDPWADILTFGARSVSLTVTGTCTNNSATVTLSSASTFINGDNVTVRGCGAPNGMGTPPAPTVTPALANSGTGLGGPVQITSTNNRFVASAAGSSTYNYRLVSRDKLGGYTPAGTVGTTTTGQATLGLTSQSITSVSRSNDTLTFTMSSTNLIVAGALIHVTGVNDPDFDGWWIVSSVSGGGVTVVVNNTPTDSRAVGAFVGDSNSSTGGTADFYVSNHLNWAVATGAWEYYVCASRPADSGAYHLIEVTKPTNTISGNTIYDVQFDDYGSTYMSNQTYPAYITDAVCTGLTSFPDPLTTTISSGAGTTSVTLAAAAGSSVVNTSNNFVFDNGPTITAACNSLAPSIPGPVRIPPGSYIVNSYTVIPSSCVLRQVGALNLNETVEVDGSTKWLGYDSSFGTPQFALSSGAEINVSASPGIYIPVVGSGMRFEHLDIRQSGSNGGLLMLWDNIGGGNVSGNLIEFTTATGSNDYLGMTFMMRSVTAAPEEAFFDNSNFLVGPNQVKDASWTPAFFVAPGQDGSGNYFSSGGLIRFQNCFWNRRGIEVDLTANQFNVQMIENYRQGGITPFVTYNNTAGGSGYFFFLDVHQDTESAGTFAIYKGSGQVSVDGILNSSQDTGGIPPSITGNRGSQYYIRGNSQTGRWPSRGESGSTGSANSPGVQCTVIFPYAITLAAGNNFCINEDVLNYNEPIAMTQQPIYWTMQPPTNVAASAVGGGSIPTGTYFISVSAVGLDGGETVPATVVPASVTLSSGTQSISVSWTGVVGAQLYNVYKCTTLPCVYPDGRLQYGNWNTLATRVSGTSVTITTNSTGNTPPTFTGTGATSLNGTFAEAPQFIGSSFGSAGVPSVTWLNDLTTGIYRVALGTIGFSSQGASTHFFNFDFNGQSKVPANGGYCFSSANGAPGASTDTCVTRSAPGVVAIGTSNTIGDFTGSVKATTAILSNLTIGGATLPTTTTSIARTSVAGSTTLLSANTCGDTVTVTVTGATTSMDAHASATISAGLIERAWVSAANTVSVQYCNVTTAGITPSATTFQVTVFQ